MPLKQSTAHCKKHIFLPKQQLFKIEILVFSFTKRKQGIKSSNFVGTIITVVVI